MRGQVLAFIFGLAFAALQCPLSASAATLDAGCHAATAAEQAEMEARGLPKSYQVCPADEKILGIGRDFDSWYAQLKQQSPCNRNNCTLSCRTRNTGAQVCGPTPRRWNSIGCHPNNQTAIFPTVSHGFAAHIELLRRYCGERGRCTIGRVVQQWTATAGDRPSYADFVSKNSGMPVNKVFDPNDVDLMGRIALAMSCFEAGSLPYNRDELKKGLVMAAGGPRVPVPPNVGELLNESLTGSYEQNQSGYPSCNPSSWPYPQSSLSNGNYTPPTPPSNPLPIINGSSTPDGSGGNDSTSNSGLLIIVQPQTVKRGNMALVSWVSTNVKAGSCTVSKNGQNFADGTEGTKRDLIAGSVEYVISCTTQSGASAQSKATVTIQ